jgi:hypothetical protein
MGLNFSMSASSDFALYTSIVVYIAEFQWWTQAEVAKLHSEHPDIIWATEETYKEIELSVENPELRDAAHIRPVCHKASEIMIAALGIRGYKAHLFESESGDGHAYGVLRSERGVIVADPTWCQFFYYDMGMPLNEVQEMPKVLVGTRSEVVAFAKEAGLDDETLNHWRRGHGAISTQRLYEDEVEEYIVVNE